VKKLGPAAADDKATGDRVAGKVVYEQCGGCSACHAIGSRGGNLGTDLTDIWPALRARGLEGALLKSEADPDELSGNSRDHQIGRNNRRHSTQ